MLVSIPEKENDLWWNFQPQVFWIINMVYQTQLSGKLNASGNRLTAVLPLKYSIHFCLKLEQPKIHMLTWIVMFHV